MRKTKIICTLGPASDDPETLQTLIRGGMNAARFNFSHGSHKEHLERLNRFKSIRDTLGVPVATILDTKGPEIRIRSFDVPSIELQAGDMFVLTTEDVIGTRDRVSVTYAKLHEEIVRTTLAGAVEKYSAEEPRGEFVLVIRGAQGRPPEDAAEDAVDYARQLAKDGLSLKDAAKQASERFKTSRNSVYAVLLEEKRAAEE